MKLNAKKIQERLAYIEYEFGDIEKVIELNNGNDVFYLVTIVPNDERQYKIVCTIGFSVIKLKMAYENVEGFEFFMCLPKEWKYSNDENDLYDDGWVQIVFEELFTIMTNGGIIVPGSTLRFQHLKNGSKHSAMLVGISTKFEATFYMKKKIIPYLELQSLLPNEVERIIAKDTDLIVKIMSLPFVDMSRESLV